VIESENSSRTNNLNRRRSQRTQKETGEGTTKGSLQEAVEHYLECPYTNKEGEGLKKRIEETKSK